MPTAFAMTMQDLHHIAALITDLTPETVYVNVDPHVYCDVTVALPSCFAIVTASVGFEGHLGHHLACLMPTPPGFPSVGRAEPHSHLLCFTLTAPGGFEGHLEHHRASFAPLPLGSP